MAVRNGGAHLRDTIDSVLAQSFADYEFLVVDDASTDDTADILSDYRARDHRIRVLRNAATLGPYPSANRALAEARGDVIARHDADDLSPPDRFAIQLEALGADPGAVLVAGAVEAFDESSRTIEVSRPPAWQPRLEWELLFLNALGAGSQVAFPRVVQGHPVLFSTRRAYAEDYELWCRLCRLGRVIVPDAVVYRYRQHASSITARHKTDQQNCAAEIRHAYQSQFLQSPATVEETAEVSRFWNLEGERPLATRVRRIDALLRQLRASCLADVERRYGAESRAALVTEVDTALNDRVGYWLYRSTKFLDARACRDLLAMSIDADFLSAWGAAFGYYRATLRRRVA
jgi:hypothetical protein